MSRTGVTGNFLARQVRLKFLLFCVQHVLQHADAQTALMQQSRGARTEVGMHRLWRSTLYSTKCSTYVHTSDVLTSNTTMKSAGSAFP